MRSLTSLRSGVRAALRTASEIYLSVYVLGVSMAHWNSDRLNESAGWKFFGLVTLMLFTCLTISVQIVMELRLPAWIAIGLPGIVALATSTVLHMKTLPRFSERFEGFERQKRQLLLWSAAALSVASLVSLPLLIDSYRETIFTG